MAIRKAAENKLAALSSGIYDFCMSHCWIVNEVKVIKNRICGNKIYDEWKEKQHERSKRKNHSRRMRRRGRMSRKKESYS